MEQNKNNEEYIPLRFGNKNVPKREKTLIEIFQIISKNKKILIGTVSAFLVGALIYAFTATPLYEASATLKKESNPNERRLGSGTDISTLLSLQSTDEIETELELIKTYKVAAEVTEDLNLYVKVKEIVWGLNGKKFEIEKPFIEIDNSTFKEKASSKFYLPQKFFIKISDPNKKLTGEFSIIKKDNDSYILKKSDAKDIIDEAIVEPYKEKSFSVLDTLKDFSIKKDTTSFCVLKNEDFSVEFNWPDAPDRSVFNFVINDFNKTAIKVAGDIKVSRVGKTNIFKLGFTSSSPYAAALITNTVVEKYRDARMEQKKQTIRYSYNTVDKQLLEVQEKLKETENILSSFKSSGQIITIDASSQNLIGYLSRLEAEKVNIDLQLSDYKNKVNDLEKELSNRGYFDQSYLGPDGRGDGNTPFSQMMKQLADLELQKIELLQKRTENHPDVRAIDDQIRVLKEKLAGFNENTITAYKIMISTLEKKLLKIVDMMSKYESKLQSLPAQENKLAQILRQKATYEKIFTILLDQREAMRVAELSSPQDITIVDEAKIPTGPSWPRKSMILLISFVIGTFLGILLIFTLELRRTKFVNLDELEEEFKVPVLSIIPKYSKEIQKVLETSKSEQKIALFTVNDDGLKETYRLLKTKLFKQLGSENRIIMVTSCEENSGKTTVVANLAASLALEGKKALVIDCDLRKGELSKMFGLGNERKGLLDFLENDNPPKIFTIGSKYLSIIPAGGLSSDSGALLNSSRMRLLFNSIDVSQYELIIVDTPPVTRVVDTLILSHSIRDGILVVRPQHSLIDTVRWGMSELLNSHINIKGIVVNAAEIENSYYYKHRYGYGYGYGSKNGNGKAKKVKSLEIKDELRIDKKFVHKN